MAPSPSNETPVKRETRPDMKHATGETDAPPPGVEFIAPPEELKAKAPLSSASLDTLLYKADRSIAEMTESFVDTARKGFKRLTAAFGALKPDTAAPGSARALFVAAHDLRGQAGTPTASAEGEQGRRQQGRPNRDLSAR